MSSENEPMTRDEFEALPPWQKGYVVYMAGCRSDQPNIPEHYEPTPEERQEYDRGQHQAMLAVMDSEA